MEHPLLIGFLAVGLLAGNVALVAGSASAADSNGEPVEFGMGPGSIEAQQAEGVAPDYETMWIGPWTLEYGWGGATDRMEYMQSQGVTPVIHLYYWGDDISPTCVEEGCYSDIHDTWKDKQEWQRLTQELVDHLQTTMDGDPVVVLLETEFNKNGIEDYEAFDGYLADKADFIHQGYAPAEIVLPFGNWKDWAWDTYDRSASAADYIGLQGMRGSTRDSWDSYRYLYEDTLEGTQKLQNLFGKPIFLHDIALSSYPEPDYLQPQADELSEFFERMDELKANGVQAMIYRSWFDSPSMDTSNYYGEAERHWGFAYPDTGEHKPAAQVWIDGVKAERGGTSDTGPTFNGTLREAENFATKTTGGHTYDGAATNGEAWNVWANGYIEESFDLSPGEYRVAVNARGTPADGTQARMEVSLDGEPVTAAHVTGEYASYTERVNVSGGENLRVAFTNDAVTDTEDRNLIVDRVTFAEIEQEPTAVMAATTEGLTVNLDAANSSDPDGDALRYEWTLGDGTTLAGPTINHTYEAEGTYEIGLTVDDGNATDQVRQNVTVEEPNRAPSAAFDTNTDGLTVSLDAANSSDPDGDRLAHAWDLGDGNAETGELVTHTYDEAGTYNVTLSVDDGQLSDQTNQTIAVEPNNRAPNASFDAETDGLTVSLDAANSTDPDGDTLAYNWSLGDGTNATGPTFNHSYDEAGTYNVTLTVTDGELGDAANETLAVEPNNRAPNASFDAETDGLTVSLDAANSTDPDGDALRYAWSLGDGTNATGPTLNHTYDEAGTYNVTLTVSDGSLSDNRSETVTVEDPNRPPTAAFTTASDGLTVRLDASESSDPDGDALAHEWSLGDGNATQGSPVTHTYAQAGTYNVTLTVDDGEHSDEANETITVEEPNRPPNATFADRTDGLTVHLDARNSSDPDGDALDYVWTLGDGTNLRGPSLNHSYDEPGTYNVTLTVSDGNATDTTQETITVEHPNRDPHATFTATTEGLEASLDAADSTDPDGDTLAYNWSLGDGTNATGPTPNHTYRDAGTYNVTLTVTDGELSDTTDATVTVNRAPNATFADRTDGLTVHLDARNSSDPDGDALDYVWTLGDGTNLRGPSVNHSYDEPGTYTVTLAVHDGETNDTTKRNVTVERPNRAPNATFTVTTEGLEVTLDAGNSSDPDGDRLRYAWELGDGTTAQGSSLAHSYEQAGSYEVNLTASDGELRDRTSKTVTVEEPTEAYPVEFTPKSQGNEWWIEVDVSADPDPIEVEARIDGGDWFDLDKQDWGSWATSRYVEPGSTVQFRAISSVDSGHHHTTSAEYAWNDNTTSGDSFDPSFDPYAQGNEWWLEVDVQTSADVTRVQARLDGGDWFDLDEQDWGHWAKSVYVEPGTQVEFKATSASGAQATSPSYTWAK